MVLLKMTYFILFYFIDCRLNVIAMQNNLLTNLINFLLVHLNNNYLIIIIMVFGLRYSIFPNF